MANTNERSVEERMTALQRIELKIDVLLEVVPGALEHYNQVLEFTKTAFERSGITPPSQSLDET